jgi:hypothetical protein
MSRCAGCRCQAPHGRKGLEISAPRPSARVTTSDVRDSRLEDFCTSFLGFGDLNSPWWFVSYNPHYARQAEHYLYRYRRDGEDRAARERAREQETLALMDLWSIGRPSSLNLDDYRARLGHQLSTPKPGSKLARLAEIYLRLNAQETTWDALRITADDLGTPRCNAFLAELNPVERSAFYSLRGRFTTTPWKAHGFQRSFRASILAEAVRRYNPRLVLMYGWSGARYWDKIAGLLLSGRRTGLRREIATGASDGINFVAILSPSAYWLPQTSFSYVLEQISSLIR